MCKENHIKWEWFKGMHTSKMFSLSSISVCSIIIVHHDLVVVFAVGYYCYFHFHFVRLLRKYICGCSPRNKETSSMRYRVMVFLWFDSFVRFDFVSLWIGFRFVWFWSLQTHSFLVSIAFLVTVYVLYAHWELGNSLSSYTFAHNITCTTQFSHC